MSGRRPALLVAHRNALLASGGGGVQVCCREYAAALREAGFDLTEVAFDHAAGFADRLLRRAFPKVSNVRTPPGLAARIEGALDASGARHVFFALNAFPDVSRRLRAAHPGVTQVFLSQGLESVDFCIEQRLRRRDGTENRPRARAERMLGRQLLDEARERGALDAVLTLSPIEADLERWLGARDVLWVPRTLVEAPLAARPVDGRVGCVSTLDHPPNRDGLERLFEALADLPPGFRFRLVGGPRPSGERVAARHGFVDYLGPLDDGALRAEAATWCCFAHPLFVQAKGCSTKLAAPLAWGLPIATTPMGARGYVWDRGAAPLAESPAAMARDVIAASSAARFAEGSARTRRIADGTPRLPEVAAAIRAFLDGLDARAAREAKP